MIGRGATHRVGFAGVGHGKRDRIAWNAAFAEEHAGEERADEGAYQIVSENNVDKGDQTDGRRPRDGGSG